jgi:DNA-binding NarL/FixJ family response regulator
MSIKLILADDHAIIRNGLRALFERQADVKVLADAANGRDAVRLVSELQPDVVVLDVSMPELNGLEATRQIRKNKFEGGIVILSSHAERRYVAQAREAGADGFVHKEYAFEHLNEAIQKASKRQTYLSPNLLDATSMLPLPPVTSLLTGREREVLQLLAEGQNVKEIAYRLEISVKTVETHRSHIMSKLRIDNLADLTRIALREGITEI